MVKYRLHNITNFGVEIHDFYAENSLNNYIAIFVDPPYWVENLQTGEKIYTGYTDTNNTNVSRETLHETELEWLSRHVPIEEKEPSTTLEKISSFLGILSVIIMATFLLYLFLSTASFLVEHFSEYTWKIFNIL